MLACGNPAKIGYIEYRCLQCGEGTHRVVMSCKSSLCLRCAKVYVDNWVSQVSRMLHEGIIYRHIVLTMPAMLRKTFYQQATAVLSPFIRCGVRCLDDCFSRISGKALKGGYIVVIQTHGRNGQYNPHLHLIATSGGWDHKGHQWVHLDYLPYAMLRKKWQWHLLTMLRQTVKTKESHRLVDACDRRYREGFVTNVQKGDVPSRYQSLATYLAKYVVSPPISLRRIDRYDGPPGDLSLSVPQKRAGRAGNGGCLHVYRAHDSACVSQRLSTGAVLRGAGNQDVCQDQARDSRGLGHGQGDRQGRDQNHRADDLPPALSTEHRARSLVLSALSQ